jgi:hypothetical protein
MNHRVVSGVVVFIVLVLCLAAALFAVAMSVDGPDTARGQAAVPVIIHPLDREFADCAACHTVGGDNPLPATHSEFSAATCQTCHRAAVAVTIPHPAGPGTQQQNCLACHSTGAATMPPESHAGYDNSTCLHCHRLASGAAAAPTPAPAGDAARPAPGIPHPADGAYTTCTECHQVGGSLPMPASHGQYDVVTCQECHQPAAAGAGAASGQTATPAPQPVATRAAPVPTATTSAP